MNDQYLHIELEDLIQDEKFQDYVLLQSNEEQWEAWLATHEEQKPIFDEAAEMIRALQFAHEPFEGKAKVWTQIESTIDNSTKATTPEINISTHRRKRKSSTLKLWWLSAAAACAIALVWMLSQVPNYEVAIRNDNATVQHISLPQGSRVSLDPKAIVHYNENTWNESRLITLTGKATFDVTKGTPFEVNTRHGKVEVLGTVFTVDDTRQQLQVNVSEGVVQVTTTKGKQAILKKGMSLSINPTKNTGNTEKTTQASMIYQFEGAALTDVITTIEHVYGLSIDTSNIDVNRKYTGFFTATDPQQALESVFWPLGYEYTLQGKKVTLQLK